MLAATQGRGPLTDAKTPRTERTQWRAGRPATAVSRVAGGPDANPALSVGEAALGARSARVAMKSLVHVPVMVEQVAAALVTDRSGCYVDATFGAGGHARRLLADLSPQATLLAVDRDADAVAGAERLAREDPRLLVRRGRFSQLREHLTALGLRDLSGAIFDVGVSSPQLDDAERGFSFAADGPLDMRMNQHDGLTAAAWLNRAPESEIADVIRRYGEEHHARRVARGVVRHRPLTTTSQLAEVVAKAVPMPTSRNAATQIYARVFQAVRIHVNDELTELERGLDTAFAALAVGGRLAVVTFHGLEHRLVRRRFRQWVEGPALPPRLPIRDLPPPLAQRVDAVGKGLRPTMAEVHANPRSRSALLQAVQKLRPLAEARP